MVPWLLADTIYCNSAGPLDPKLTVFVGDLHVQGKTNAEGLMRIFHELFGGVVYVGIDVDKHQYPTTSCWVTFSNTRSYNKAVFASFVDIKTPKFSTRVKLVPYLSRDQC